MTASVKVRRFGVFAALLLVAVCLTWAASAAAESPSGRLADSSARGGDALYAEAAQSGTLKRIRGNRGTFRLVLSHVGTVRTRGDHPATESLRHFVRHWRARGFSSDPPTAALVLAGAPSSADVALLELSRPRLGRGGRSVSYRARRVQGASAARLARFVDRADPSVASHFGRARLLIDAGSGTLGVGGPLSTALVLKFSIPRVPMAASGGLGVFFRGPAIAEVNFTANDPVHVSSEGPASFDLAPSGSGFTISSSVSTGAEVDVAVTAFTDPITGRVLGQFDNMVTVQTSLGATADVNGSTGAFSISAH